MANDGQLVYYPTGQVQIGASDLQHAASARFSIKNGGKLVSTLRLSPAGFVRGLNENDGSIEALIPEDGMELDYINAVLRGTPVQARFKIPRRNLVFNGFFVSLDGEMPLGDVIKFTLGFVHSVVPK